VKLEDLLEMPYLNDEELSYQVLAKISTKALNKGFEEFSKTKDLTIYSNKETSGFIAGYLRAGHLSTVIKIASRQSAYPIEPAQVEDYHQVSMVSVSKEYALTGNAKAVYEQIAKKVPLVSDHEQYIGAQGLWKSLARSSDVFIYVFNSEVQDYIRDQADKIVKYNSKNIEDDKIWGTDPTHRMVLLVATIKELE
jgi:hypothetical protein